MVAEATTRRAAPARPALARLVGDVDAFAESAWGCAPLLRSAEPDDPDADRFADLFGLDAVDELVSVRGLRTPFLRLVKDGTTIPERAYVGGGGIGAAVPDQARDDGILAQVGAGATLVLQGLHRVWEPLLRFTQQLSADLGHPVQANAYVTPPQSRGFGSHYDVHDVFVLQVHGEKRWHIHEPVFPLPLRSQPGDRHADAIARAAAQAPLLDVVLRPGDCLYLPRGYLHSATALGGVSAHLTIGVPAWTRFAVVEQLLDELRARLADDEPLRGSLPLGVDPAMPHALDEVVAQVRATMRRELASIGSDRIAARLVAAQAPSQRPAPLPPFAQLAAARQLTPTAPVKLREHLALRREATDSGGALLVGRHGWVAVPPEEVAGLDAILAAGDARPAGGDAAGARCARDLPLPEPAAVALIERLLLGGVVVPAAPTE